MPNVQFEIIRVEDIGKHLIKPSATKHNSGSNHKLSDADIQNLKHYLQRHNRSPASNQNQEAPTRVVKNAVDTSQIFHQDYVDITQNFYSSKSYSALLEPAVEHSQPLADVYRYHHHHRRHHHQTKHAHEVSPTTSTTDKHDDAFRLEVATCGMKKNTRLPVPRENYSLADGSFGDDAGFAMRQAQQNFLGIADGAGGNTMYGFDPRLFSESLMRNCSHLAHTGKYSTHEPKRLLCHAFDRVQNENCFGSATACVIGFDCRTGRLHSVNIGDSGYVVVRHGRVVYRSKSQKMNGDCPRQLDVYPWTASLKRKGLNYTQISSLDAICQNFQLELDDVIVLSTDGLFDNVPDRLLERILSANHSLKHAANELVTRAVRFYIKPDDILVIMARVTTNNSHT